MTSAPADSLGALPSPGNRSMLIPQSLALRQAPVFVQPGIEVSQNAAVVGSAPDTHQAILGYELAAL